MPMGRNEAKWLTQKMRIDTKLRSLNPAWQIIPWHDGLDTSKLTCHVVTEIPTACGPADDALFVNGLLLGIIEAKIVTVNPGNVLGEAKCHSSGQPHAVRGQLAVQDDAQDDPVVDELFYLMNARNYHDAKKLVTENSIKPIVFAKVGRYVE